MAIINAHFDESGKHKDHPVVTFCGVCAPQPKLQQFDEAWNSLLRLHGLCYLHMVQALRTSRKISDKIPRQTADQRIEALKPFADCINEHLELGLIHALDVKGFNSLSKDAKVKLGSPDDPYYVAFTRGILELTDYVHDDDRISLICDDDPETAWDCYRHYRGIRHVHDLVRKKTVSLSFADDKYFPALQAADMVAALCRLEAKRLFYGIPYSFGPLLDYLIMERSPTKMEWKAMFADEECLKNLSKSLEEKSK